MVLSAGGCVERYISVTSEPPGALVWINDVQVGKTPVEASFLYHGNYDVRLEMPGYKPIVTGAKAKAPWYEYPGVDLLAQATPMKLKNEIQWHFVLEPVDNATDESAQAALVDRARALRSQLEDDSASAPESDPAPVKKE